MFKFKFKNEMAKRAFINNGSVNKEFCELYVKNDCFETAGCDNNIFTDFVSIKSGLLITDWIRSLEHSEVMEHFDLCDENEETSKVSEVRPAPEIGYHDVINGIINKSNVTISNSNHSKTVENIPNIEKQKKKVTSNTTKSIILRAVKSHAESFGYDLNNTNVEISIVNGEVKYNVIF